MANMQVAELEIIAVSKNSADKKIKLKLKYKKRIK
jgi:hypothetical protein